MKERLLYAFIIMQLFVIKSVHGQQITGTLTYNFKDGSLILSDTKKPIGRTPTKPAGAPPTRIFGLKQGQGVAILVTNINPLKYYAQSSAAFTTITSPPPAFTGIDVNSLFTQAPAAKAAETAAPATKPAAAPAKPVVKGIAPKGPPVPVVPIAPDGKKIIDMKGKIGCIKTNTDEIKNAQTKAQEIGKVFQSFNSYYELMKTLDNLDQATYTQQVDAQLVSPIKALTATGYAKQLNSAAEINATNLAAIKNDILSKIDGATKAMDDCYSDLYDLLLANPVEKAALQEEYKKGKYNTETELMLSQLPDTKKEYIKLQDWAKTARQTINDKLWPEIDKSLALFNFAQNLSFQINAGTIMVDEDIADITISVKKVADNQEVKKVERIKFHTIGGFRMEYGVGLYMSGLGDDEFVLDRSTKIEKVAVLNGTNIDTVLQNVNYTTARQSSSKNLNWGAMTFFQGRTNWGGWFNVGGYFGLGLLLNNNTKPIFSAGASFVFGTIPRGNLNIGTAWGKVNRLNPKYELGKEYKGDIVDPTVSQTHSRLLIGITWNLGKINTGTTGK